MLKTITGMALVVIICSSCAQKIVPADNSETNTVTNNNSNDSQPAPAMTNSTEFRKQKTNIKSAPQEGGTATK